jgi:uncharacterized protein YcgL (UPF0745 family)
MTHKYERVSKLIKETFGEPNQFMSDHYIKDHDDLVRLCYAVLEEFQKPQSIKIIDDGYEW